MKKGFMKRVALLLAVCMTFGVFSGTIVVSAQDNTINYVSLGDSMTNGYCLEGYKQGDLNDGTYDFMNGVGVYSTYAYPTLLENYLTQQGYEVNHARLAPSAMRADEVYYLLGGLDRLPDDGWGGLGYTNVSDHAALKEYYTESLENADLITLALGNASFGAFMMQKLADALGLLGATTHYDFSLEQALEIAEGDEELQAHLIQLHGDLQNKLGLIGGGVAPAKIMEACDIATYTAATFYVYYKGVVKTILEMNPDVTILFLGLMNTTYGLNIVEEDGTKIPVGDMMGDAFASMNEFIKNLPAELAEEGVDISEADCRYVDIGDIEFICQKLIPLRDANWGTVDGVDGQIVRRRNITAYNNNLRAMVGAMFGMELPKITLADLDSFNPDIPLVASVMSGDLKGLSVAIYFGIEDAVVDNATLNDIPRTAVEMMLNDISQAFAGLTVDYNGTLGKLHTDLAAHLNSTPDMQALCKIYGMFKVGDGMSVHPTAGAHDVMIEKIIQVLNEQPEPETTEAPATEAPATEAPATEAPATEAPATEAPAPEFSWGVSNIYVNAANNEWKVDLYINNPTGDFWSDAWFGIYDRSVDQAMFDSAAVKGDLGFSAWDYVFSDRVVGSTTFSISNENNYYKAGVNLSNIWRNTYPMFDAQHFNLTGCENLQIILFYTDGQGGYGYQIADSVEISLANTVETEAPAQTDAPVASEPESSDPDTNAPETEAPAKFQVGITSVTIDEATGYWRVDLWAENFVGNFKPDAWFGVYDRSVTQEQLTSLRGAAGLSTWAYIKTSDKGSYGDATVPSGRIEFYIDSTNPTGLGGGNINIDKYGSDGLIQDAIGLTDLKIVVFYSDGQFGIDGYIVAGEVDFDLVPEVVETEAPATEEPATEAPATEAPATEAPATEAPATEAPATEAPATEEPATEAPATEEPATEAPATEAPATEAPATEEPATEAPESIPSAVITVGAASGKPGDTVQVYVSISEVPVYAIQFALSYDSSALKPISGKWLQSSFMSADWDEVLNLPLIVFAGNRVLEGDIFVFTFEILDTAEPGTAAWVTLDAGALWNDENSNSHNIDVEVLPGSVYVEASESSEPATEEPATEEPSTDAPIESEPESSEPEPDEPDEPAVEGDFDGNDALNSNDALYLLRASLDSTNFPIVADGDVNHDGSFNSNDALYLLRHTLNAEAFPLYPEKV